MKVHFMKGVTVEGKQNKTKMHGDSMKAPTLALS